MFARSKFPLVLLSVVALACEGRDRPDSPLAPAPAPSAAVFVDENGAVYQQIVGTAPRDLDDDDRRWIGAGGGTLSAGGHMLIVPPGAVDRPTEFRMDVKTDGYLRVDLRARAKDYDFGKRGFLKPVTLSLTYSWASNVEDASDLLVMWLRDDNSVEAQASEVDPVQRQVSAQLSHFSRYGLVSN